MPAKQPNEEKTLGELLGRDGAPDPTDESLAQLEGQVDELTNKLYEERFTWILICVVLINFFVFAQMETWSAPIVIGLMELIGLVILAERCKVDAMMPIIDRLTGAFQNHTGSKPRD